MTNPLRALSLTLVPARLAQRLQFRLREPSRQRRVSRTSDKAFDNILSEIDREGFYVIEDYMCACDCNEAINQINDIFSKYRQYVWKMDDRRIFGIEHVSSIAKSFNSDSIWTKLATSYMGEPNKLIFTMANIVKEDGTNKLGSGGGWHRDCFSRELKVILYLTDVGPDNGPFQILRRSHSKSNILKDMKRARLSAIQNRLTDSQVAKLVENEPDRRVALTAKAGTAIVFDDSSIHTGTPIRSGSRYALTNYFMAQRLFSESSLDYYEPMIRKDSTPSAC